MAEGSVCPRYHKAVELLGRRWNGAIVQAMLGGSVRYNEIKATIPDISDRMLAERLRELELEDVVARKVIPTTPVRVEYELTAKGRALKDAVLAISRWAEEWISAPALEIAREG